MQCKLATVRKIYVHKYALSVPNQLLTLHLSTPGKILNAKARDCQMVCRDILVLRSLSGFEFKTAKRLACSYTPLHQEATELTRQNTTWLPYIPIGQGWANSGPRATCDPPQRFQWPAEQFMSWVDLIWRQLIFGKKKHKLVQGTLGIEGTGRLSSRCPSTVKLVAG